MAGFFLTILALGQIGPVLWSMLRHTTCTLHHEWRKKMVYNELQNTMTM